MRFSVVVSGMIPKRPIYYLLRFRLTFGTMLNRMVSKHKSKMLCRGPSFGTMSNRIVPKLSENLGHNRISFGTMSNRIVPKPRILYLT